MDCGEFSAADVTTLFGLDRLGLEATGQRILPGRAEIACRIIAADDHCHACGAGGIVHDTVVRRLSHTPVGFRPTMLVVTVRRYQCVRCGRTWRQDMGLAAEPRGKLSKTAMMWGLQAVVAEHLTIARVAECLAVSWNTANGAVLSAGHRLLIADPARLNNVRVLGVDEHVWRHRWGNKYVTVVIDLTPVRDKTGPSRLLDMVPGRSKQVFAAWLRNQSAGFRDGIEVVAMDGFTGFKTAAAEALPQAVEVMDPFHVVALAADAVEKCRQRVQQDTCGDRGHAGEPLYAARRILLTGTGLLTDRQRGRLAVVFADNRHIPIEVTWDIYQRIVAAYRAEDNREGYRIMRRVITSLAHGIPKQLAEAAKLGRTLNRRAHDILAYFNLPGTSNGPTEAVNGRLEHLRGSALGFRNLANYITRSLLETGGFRPETHSLL